MSLAKSRITSQGQVSVPAKVRQKLGVGPGSILVWVEEAAGIVVRRVGVHSSEDIHAALFPDGVPERKSLGDIERGLRKYIQTKHEGG